MQNVGTYVTITYENSSRKDIYIHHFELIQFVMCEIASDEDQRVSSRWFTTSLIHCQHVTTNSLSGQNDAVNLQTT